MQFRSTALGRTFTGFVGAGLLAFGCTSDPAETSGNGGAAGHGDAGRANGGASLASGGTVASLGGTTNVGGTSSLAGRASGGSSSTAGAAGLAGANSGAGAAGALTNVAGNAGSAGAATPSVPRPQLSQADAESFTILKYLEKGGAVSVPVTDNWDPTAGIGDVTALVPDYTVSASGSHRTIQAAIDQATLDNPSGTTRRNILVAEGTYREFVRVATIAPPITLYSLNADATRTVIVYDRFSGTPYIVGEPIPGGGNCIKPSAAPSGTGGVSGVAGNAGAAGQIGNPGAAGAGGSGAAAGVSAAAGAAGAPTSVTWGTSAASTLGVCAAKLWVKNLTISNDFDEATTTSSNVQAPAMTLQGDQAIFENVRFLGNQDTVQVKSSSVGIIARSYFKNCTITGDTDFIFGRGTAVFDNTTIVYTSARKSGGAILAPSTDKAQPFGFLVINSHLTVDVPAATNVAYLGRAWDESVTSGTWTTSSTPNGQALIRNSSIDGFIRAATPWATSTSGRLFDSNVNRLYEYQNTGIGAATL